MKQLTILHLLSFMHFANGCMCWQSQ